MPASSIIGLSRIGSVCAALLASGVAAPCVADDQSGASSAQSVRLIVEPDYLISGDNDRPRVEIMAAANPRDAKNLLAGVISFTKPSGGPVCMGYVTHDGGLSWDAVNFREQLEFGGGDPQVAYTRAGTAIFLGLCMAPDHTGRTHAMLHAYRSEDQGRTWSEVFDMGGSYDHPMLTADQTNGRFAGNLYVSVLYGREYKLGVFRSEDDGRSWIGPVQFISGQGERGLNVDPMLVLSDGVVVVPFIEFPSNPQQQESWGDTHLWTVTSDDGCVSFSQPNRGPRITRMDRDSADARLGGWLNYAADRSDRFTDRIYAAWPEFGGSTVRTTIAWSDDRGKTWSSPKQVAPHAGDHIKQFQPTVEVNKDGVVGVTWFDTRESSSSTSSLSSELAFHQYFAASVDGGETFTDPVRLSSVVSKPMGSGNLTPAPTTFQGPDGELRVSTLSAAGRWLSGGDYIGHTSDANGVFHPVWPDARTGSYQLYTTRVRVVEGDDATTDTVDTSTMTRTDITADIELVSDPGSYDAQTKELTWWIRLKNNSAQTIHGPIELEIRKFGSGMGDVAAEFAPQILNATNGKSSSGAVFIYDDALGTSKSLPPGAVSGAMMWKLRLKEHLRTPNLHVFATGLK